MCVYVSLPECPEGWFGAGCSEHCDCNGAVCDSVTGRCHCPAGMMGKHCGEGKQQWGTLDEHVQTLVFSLDNQLRCV